MKPIIRKPNYENEREVDRLIHLYRQYSKRFNGMVVRDSRYYWQNWIASQPQDVHSHCITLVQCSPDNSDMIEANLSVALRMKGTVVVLKVIGPASIYSIYIFSSH